MLLRSGLSAAPQGNFSILSVSLGLSNRRFRRIRSGQPEETVLE